MACNFHVDNSSKGIYDMFLDRDILRALGLNIKLSDHVIQADDSPLKGSAATMIYMDTYEFKI